MASRGRKVKDWHWHGCKRCHQCYYDTCEELDSNGLCVLCKGGAGLTWLREGREPVACCPSNSRLPTKDERDAYRLAGDALWWICSICKRTQPYDPPQSKESA